MKRARVEPAPCRSRVQFSAATPLHLLSLTFDLLTSKSSQFIFVPKCTRIVNLVKFLQLIYEILCLQILKTHAQTDGQPENTIPPATNVGGGIKSNTLYVMTRRRYWQGIGLTIYRSRVRVLAGHLCVVAWASYLHLCASVTKQYNLLPAKGMIPLAGKVTAAWVKVTAAYHWVDD